MNRFEGFDSTVVLNLSINMLMNYKRTANIEWKIQIRLSPQGVIVTAEWRPKGERGRPQDKMATCERWLGGTELRL